jgi:hypothetical protein
VQPPKASNAITSEIERGLIYLFYEAPISLQEGWIVEAQSLVILSEAKNL